MPSLKSELELCHTPASSRSNLQHSRCSSFNGDPARCALSMVKDEICIFGIDPDVPGAMRCRIIKWWLGSRARWKAVACPKSRSAGARRWTRGQHRARRQNKTSMEERIALDAPRHAQAMAALEIQAVQERWAPLFTSLRFLSVIPNRTVEHHDRQRELLTALTRTCAHPAFRAVHLLVESAAAFHRMLAAFEYLLPQKVHLIPSTPQPSLLMHAPLLQCAALLAPTT